MEKLDNEIRVSNFAKYKKSLISYVGEEITEEIINTLGGEDAVKDASFATTTDTGLAYCGSFCKTILKVTSYAVKLNELLPEEVRADKNSLVKVALLSQVSKVVMFKENDDQWQINKRGMVYTFSELEGALRMGERSILICMNAGVKFTENEYEAMRILDKTTDDDNYSKYYSGVLSTVIKQANELVTVISKKQA